jgi:PBP1b-binding outer membrane lipoprotein LpoB
MRRLAALALAALVLSGCGGSSGGEQTKPAHVYKPNSNQNPEYEAH